MTAQLVVLRKGDGWKLLNQDNKRVKDRFSELAEKHGSAVRWLPETGYLVTEDPNEVAKGFPYDEWRDQALKNAGHT